MKKSNVITMESLAMVESLRCDWHEGAVLLKGLSPGGRPLAIKLKLSGNHTSYLVRQLWRLHRAQLDCIKRDVATAEREMKGE